MATFNITNGAPPKILAGDILNCPYSGTVKVLTLPAGKYKLECWGAQGGTVVNGGKGGYSVGYIELHKKTTLYLYTGGQGKKNTSSAIKLEGGFNGGGYCYSKYEDIYVGSGGGASDVRINTDSLYARVIVAGGGGGNGIYPSDSSNTSKTGGVGGGTSGGNGIKIYAHEYGAGAGGSQTAGGSKGSNSSYSQGGSFGQGGNSTGNSGGWNGGGGGGGWYGGGSGGALGASGGGGSGYVYTSSTASNYPSGRLLTSEYYLTNAQTKAGNTSFPSTSSGNETGHSGNGYIRITVVYTIFGKARVNDQITNITSSYIKVNGVWVPIVNWYTKQNNVWYSNW